MHKKLKNFCSVLLALIMLACMAATVSAAEPRLSDTNSVSVRLTFSGTTASCDVTVTGAKETTSITDGHLVLTDSKGNVAGEWTDLSSSSNTLTVSKTVSGLTKGETYTLTFTGKANRNGGSENISGSVSKKCG
ncbi:MAG: hypothetical protein NC078_09930 [Ruminococcus sp.]|nr:hypothetical protein [Ruminococcus sp.]